MDREITSIIRNRAASGQIFRHKPAKRRRRQGRSITLVEHDPESWEPVFRTDQAQTQNTVTFGVETGVSPAPEPLQHVGGSKSVGGSPDRGLEAAQGLARLSAELAVRGAAIETALRQKLLQLQPLGPR